MKDTVWAKKMTNAAGLIQAHLDAHGAAIVTDTINQQYLSGFHSSDGVVLITVGKSYCLVDSRYYEHACNKVIGMEVLLLKDIYIQLQDILSSHKVQFVSLENENVTLAKYKKFTDNLPNIEFDVSSWLSDTITRSRSIKSRREIQHIEQAQRIAEKAFVELVNNFLRPGYTERQVQLRLDNMMLEMGADAISFDTIAASGENSSVPHAVPTDRTIREGDFLTLDFGAVINGYHSDMTRTVVFGKPTEEQRNVYEAVIGAMDDGAKAIRPGVTGKLVDSVARATLDAWGYESYFGHGLGHGVGLEIHESPRLSPKSTSTLEEGMVVTVEPGVYIPGKFGVRVEDMLVVSADGSLNLTKAQRRLIII